MQDAIIPKKIVLRWDSTLYILTVFIAKSNGVFLPLCPSDCRCPFYSSLVVELLVGENQSSPRVVDKSTTGQYELLITLGVCRSLSSAMVMKFPRLPRQMWCLFLVKILVLCSFGSRTSLLSHLLPPGALRMLETLPHQSKEMTNLVSCAPFMKPVHLCNWRLSVWSVV